MIFPEAINDPEKILIKTWCLFNAPPRQSHSNNAIMCIKTDFYRYY